MESSKPAEPRFTRRQAEYMAKSLTEQQPRAFLAVTDWDSDGWIFVENSQSLGQEGSGVWVDKAGFEHQGPHGFAAA